MVLGRKVYILLVSTTQSRFNKNSHSLSYRIRGRVNKTKDIISKDVESDYKQRAKKLGQIIIF